MYEEVTIPELISKFMITASLPEHFEHAARDGKTAHDIHTCDKYRSDRNPLDQGVARTYL